MQIDALVKEHRARLLTLVDTQALKASLGTSAEERHNKTTNNLSNQQSLASYPSSGHVDFPALGHELLTNQGASQHSHLCETAFLQPPHKSAEGRNPTAVLKTSFSAIALPSHFPHLQSLCSGIKNEIGKMKQASNRWLFKGCSVYPVYYHIHGSVFLGTQNCLS